MIPAIKIITEKKFIGKRLKMSLSHNLTKELWQSFMPVKKTIKQIVSAHLYCIQVYEQDYDFTKFNPESFFDKWAAVEVAAFEGVPDQLETLTLTGGLYAVFIHKGAAATGHLTFQYIYETWLPQSAYELDQRPHFEIMGEKYSNDDPASEEEVWIPVKTRQ